MAAAELALGGEYGHSLGRTLRGRRELHVMGDSLLFPDAGLYLCRVRRPYGGCDGAGDEQLRQRQSGDRGHGAGGRLRSADGRFGGADAPCAGAEPPDGDLYQTELGAALGAVRLRRGGYGVELRHRLPDGRRLPRSGLCRAEHDRQPDGDDLRRCEAQLCAQSVERASRRP